MNSETARQQVGEAIQAFAASKGLDDDQFVGDWGVVVHMPKMNDSSHAEYLLIFPTEFAPIHVARGLFETAADVANGDGWAKDGDE